jgi:hypothetical protein
VGLVAEDGFMTMTEPELQLEESPATPSKRTRFLRDLLGRFTYVIGLILLVFVAWVVVRTILDPGRYLSFDPSIVVAIGLVGAGILMLRGQQPVTDEIERTTSLERESSPLGVLTLSAAFLVVGALILIGNLELADVTIGHITAAALVVVAAGLLVGAWWGRSRLLMVVGVVLVPFVIAGGFMHFPLRGSLSSQWVSSRQIDDIPVRHEILAGSLNMNLANLRGFEGEREFDISIVAGNATIFVPERMALTVTGHIEYGNASIGHGREQGADLTLSNDLEGKPGAGHLTFNFTGGIASLYIERISYQDLHGTLRQRQREKREREARQERREQRQERNQREERRRRREET